MAERESRRHWRGGRWGGGVGFALLAALLFGLSAPFAKLLLGAIEPQLLAGLLYLTHICTGTDR